MITLKAEPQVYRNTLEKFVQSDDFKQYVSKASSEAVHGRAFWVNLRHDGTWEQFSQSRMDSTTLYEEGLPLLLSLPQKEPQQVSQFDNRILLIEMLRKSLENYLEA